MAKTENGRSWLCNKCGNYETDAMKIMSLLPAGATILEYCHTGWACPVLATEEDSWKETWS